MGPHGLIFDEDEAISCPMPLDAFPTPFGVVFGSFSGFPRFVSVQSGSRCIPVRAVPVRQVRAVRAVRFERFVRFMQFMAVDGKRGW